MNSFRLCTSVSPLSLSLPACLPACCVHIFLHSPLCSSSSSLFAVFFVSPSGCPRSLVPSFPPHFAFLLDIAPLQNEARVYQDRVVQTFMNSGPEDLVLCQACAGAGKTTTILRVVDELRKERPESCVLLTSFAKATIANFKDKAKKELGRDVDILPFLMENDIAVSKRPGLFATHLHAIGKALVPRGVSKDAAMKEADRVFKVSDHPKGLDFCDWRRFQDYCCVLRVVFPSSSPFNPCCSVVGHIPFSVCLRYFS